MTEASLKITHRRESRQPRTLPTDKSQKTCLGSKGFSGNDQSKAERGRDWGAGKRAEEKTYEWELYLFSQTNCGRNSKNKV